MIQSKVILEKEEYRFVERGIIELNGKPDYRLQKKDYYTKRWNDIYLFDNQMQCLTAMEDHQYARWLDPDRVPCYVKDYDDEEVEDYDDYYDSDNYFGDDGDDYDDEDLSGYNEYEY